MNGLSRRLLPDRFVLLLLGVVLASSLAPVGGGAAWLLDVVTFAAIFALFFVHGVRLPREALLTSMADWRLHGAILASTFLLFPAGGLVLAAAFPDLLPPILWSGVLFLCALPSTVQSSVAFTSMAKGDVAGAVAAAAGSNLLGVFLTPLLIVGLLEAQEIAISLGQIAKIVLLILVPFTAGHLLRNRLKGWVTKRPRLTSMLDRGAILLAVYGAFSAAMVEELWTRIPARDIAAAAGICLFLLAYILTAALLLGRLGSFRRQSRVTILFCGSVKSLATGVPMARILFPGSVAGPIIIPVIIFHTVQLIVCAWIAAELGRRQSGTRPG